MQIKEQYEFLVAWVRSYLPRRDEEGASALEWLAIVIAVLALAAVAYAAVQVYLNRQIDKLGSP